MSANDILIQTEEKITHVFKRLPISIIPIKIITGHILLMRTYNYIFRIFLWELPDHYNKRLGCTRERHATKKFDPLILPSNYGDTRKINFPLALTCFFCVPIASIQFHSNASGQKERQPRYFIVRAHRKKNHLQKESINHKISLFCFRQNVSINDCAGH